MIDVVAGTKCDFCSELNATWEYPARTFQVESIDDLPVRVNSVDEWLACDTCHDLIESDNWRGLAEHSIEKLGVWIEIDFVMTLHQEFRTNRIGSARKVVCREGI